MASIESLRKAFEGDIVTPSDEGYDAAISRWARNAIRRAKVVAFVKNPKDVALAIQYARAADLRLAIRGGGHNPAACSSSEGGLVIDLSKHLTTVRVDPQQKLAYVGGGAIWAAVDKAAIEHGLATVGGTVNHTGVGGLTLGGGYGFLTAAYGLVIDNLVQATVVTADGSILTANNSENSDLFWAIRGSGSNFGVVTEFVLKLHPQRRTVFAGPVIFTPDKVEQLASVISDLWTKAGEKEGMLVVMGRGPDRRPCIVTQIFYNGSEAEGREHYKALFDLKPVMDMSAEIPYEKVNTMVNDQATPGRNYYMSGAPLTAGPSPLKDLTSKHLETVARLSEAGTHHVALILEYFPYGKINSVPGDATPYRRNLPGSALALVSWENDSPENSKFAQDAARELTSLLPKGQAYGNYNLAVDADSSPQSMTSDKVLQLYGDSYAQLQALKRKYDPDMLFNKWHTIIPAAAAA